MYTHTYIYNHIYIYNHTHIYNHIYILNILYLLYVMYLFVFNGVFHIFLYLMDIMMWHSVVKRHNRASIARCFDERIEEVSTGRRA